MAPSPTTRTYNKWMLIEKRDENEVKTTLLSTSFVTNCITIIVNIVSTFVFFCTFVLSFWNASIILREVNYLLVGKFWFKHFMLVVCVSVCVPLPTKSLVGVRGYGCSDGCFVSPRRRPQPTSANLTYLIFNITINLPTKSQSILLRINWKIQLINGLQSKPMNPISYTNWCCQDKNQQ